jgi:hypothetical protein
MFIEKKYFHQLSKTLNVSNMFRDHLVRLTSLTACAHGLHDGKKNFVTVAHMVTDLEISYDH